MFGKQKKSSSASVRSSTITQQIPTPAITSHACTTRLQASKNQFENSWNQIRAHVNHAVNPKCDFANAMFCRKNIRLSRCSSALDMYFSVEAEQRRMLMKFEEQWRGTTFEQQAQQNIKIIEDRLSEYCNNLLNAYDKRHKEENDNIAKRNVSFGETTVSTFTTSSEEAPQTPTLTDSVPKDSGVHLVSSSSQSQQDDSSTQKSRNHLSDDLNSRSLEDDFEREEEKKTRRLQRIEERQEKVKKKAEIEQKRLQMEFERKQREHDEQMRQLDEKLQLRLLEAELDSSTGEMSDKSRSSTESDSEERKPSKDSSKRISDGWGDFAENMRVELPEEASGSFLRQKRPSMVSRLAEYRKRYESDEDYENPFEMETKVESTPIGRGERRYSPERSSYASTYLPTGGRYSGYSLPPVTPLVSTHRSLPKLKLREFDGNPLDWPEWSGMFLATVDSSSISNDEKMSHLKTLLAGKAKRAVNGLGYSGAMYVEAWNTLQRKFGQPHHIVSSQLAKIQNYSQVRFNDLSALVEFADTVSTFVNILQQFGYSNDLFSSSNLDIAISKLPLDTKRRWFAFIESPTKPAGNPNLVVFNKWLQEEAQVHERLLHYTPTTSKFEPNQSKFGKKPDFKKSSKNESSFSSNDSKDKSEVKCPIDGSDHRIWNCEKFKSMKIDERYNVAKEKNLCFCCLGDNHPAKDCPRKRKCGIDGCEKTHNKFLHYAKRPENSKPTTKTEGTNLTSNAESVRGLMQIARVRIFGRNGQFEDTLACCDTGSTQTWVDEDLLQKLDLKGETISLNVTGIHGTQVTSCQAVQATIGPANSMKNRSKSLTVHSQKNLEIGKSVYNVQEMKQTYPYLKCVGFKQIDLKKVTIILGQNAYELIRPLEYKNGGENKPWAVKLPLGWTISGPVPVSELRLSAACHVSNEDDVKLAEVVKKWWDMESYGTLMVADKRTKEDKLASEILNSTIKFNGDRYEVGLLWNGEQAALSNNFSSALGQLRGLKRRLDADESLKLRYSDTIASDLKKGYVSILSSDELAATTNQPVWYMPHHPVLNPHKPDKVRRVCNAASKFRGYSLNDMLLAGPDLLASLMGILARFREQKYALSADIEEMFLQVEVKPEDRQFLRFLWFDKNDRIVTYQYNRHIFGAKSSPTCANFALQRCALDNANGSERASYIACHNFYMDDLLVSLSSQQDAAELKTELTTLLAKGGFKLTKWATNFKENEVHDKALTILGLEWNNKTDTLKVCRGMEFEPESRWTQRKVLSVVSSVFDPLGFLAPFVIRGRIILKGIWQTKGQQWDSFIEDDLNNQFSNWVAELNAGEAFDVPRWYQTSIESVRNELHVFGDASEDAFCAVAYVVTEDNNQDRKVSFIMGKARVAPVKHHTIPKLELMAAITGNRLKDSIMKEHSIHFHKVYLWSDSTTVIQWIRTSNEKQPTFVANRVAEILDSSTVDEWHHVAGAKNPADLGTRGLNFDEVASSNWIQGPEWLRQPIVLDEDNQHPAEQDMNVQVFVSEEETVATVDWERFSQFNRLRRTVAWILTLSRKDCQVTDLLQEAETVIWKLVQKETYAKELKDLRSDKPVSSNSKIVSLSPFMDSDGVMRAKGRLRKADLSYETKHPVILPSKHRAVELYLNYQHKVLHHEGVEYIRNEVQKRFWIFGLRNALRAVKHNCVRCRLFSNSKSPQMSDLPVDRVTNEVRPFTNTGVDYFGPFEVKLFRRTVKKWVCLFTCLSVRAVHLELVDSLDTAACIDAVHRFIARRGQPMSIISDNGTNFVGAAREFKEAFQELNADQMTTSLAEQGIKWTFNPPAAPHFGGVWERLVRSCKKALFNVLGKQSLTEDKLRTVLCIVEQLVNNRPLTDVSGDVTDLQPLTPNHFLIGQISVQWPNALFSGTSASYRKLFRDQHSILVSVWNRWMNEYLPSLQQRSKWAKEELSEPKVGDLVWILDKNVHPFNYPLGRIEEVYPSDDKIIRSALVKTAAGSYKRPVVKLIQVNSDRK